MKKALKAVNAPVLLSNYKAAHPNATWTQLKDDFPVGDAAYQACRTNTISDQKKLCAYCELDISQHPKSQCRIEHFHPKSDTSNPFINWALDWNNMLAVCMGGSNAHETNPQHHIKPTSQNLSCDAHKDQMIQSGKLPLVCEGWIINPLQIFANPSLFKINKGNGFIEADTAGCQLSTPFVPNFHASTFDLVTHTIKILNLNCDRLATARLMVSHDIERNKKQQRMKGFPASVGLANMAHHYFRTAWPQFFTTIRYCLGPAAEQHLQSLNYNG